MKNLINFFIIVAFLSLAACGGSKTKTDENKDSKTEKTDETSDESTDGITKVYKVKSGHFIYKTTMDMTIETWFDDYGNKQYSESMMEILGQKSGSYTYIIDGFKYDYSIDSKEGTKMEYYAAAASDYSDVSDEDIEKYGIKFHGKETIAGKECTVVSIAEPVESKVWIWEGIPMKTVSKFGKDDFVMEITTIEIKDIDNSIFKLPEGIDFKKF